MNLSLSQFFTYFKKEFAEFAKLIDPYILARYRMHTMGNEDLINRKVYAIRNGYNNSEEGQIMRVCEISNNVIKLAVCEGTYYQGMKDADIGKHMWSTPVSQKHNSFILYRDWLEITKLKVQPKKGEKEIIIIKENNYEIF